MNECLVTKLKASVNDDSLSVLGGFICSVQTNTSGYFNVASASSEEVRVEILDDAYAVEYVSAGGRIIDSKNAVAGPLGGDTYVGITTTAKEKKLNIKITNKYALTAISSINGWKGSLANLSYCNKLEKFSTTYGFGVAENTEIFPSLPSLKQLTLIDSFNGDNSFLEGNVSNILNGLNPSICTSINFNLSKVKYGDLTKLFGRFINLTVMKFDPTFTDNRLTGTIESFVQEQRRLGRSVCDGINIGLGNYGVTFNETMTYSSSDNKTLSWTEDTITLNGVTINA